ncbi:si:ch211-191a24.3 isoform X2 [Tachysurus vachellii]|uniref:si:ch211-191a24.3 isoform X2 n=1 Tax=Tachysurus vachellii TaxID=175792 RepID=UPI00296B557F|nr:si:ch211-191a24.3 isoform X2 [Tachysurus vachellii]
MAEEREFDLNYMTERIIAVSFNHTCPEKTYLHNLYNITQMLQSKHSDKYMVMNLSEPREELSRINVRVLDVGWPEQHAPSLHLLCSVCKSIENWLNTHSEHVLLLHCRGTKDRIGVVISSYINLPSVSGREEKALDCYTMKKFYSDKMASLMTPSQKRYVQMFGKLLVRQIKINASPLLFHCISLKHLPNLHPTGGLFVRVYQDMQLVCTTGVHQVSAEQTDKVYFALEPPQLLKGDIMIVCYHKNIVKRSRETVFRIQFHTGTLHGHTSVFHKKDLDLANTDPRFLEEGQVEVIFSENMAKLSGFPQVTLYEGSVGWKNSSAVIIDYDTLDPLVHWDSYENITAGAQLTECTTSSVSSDSGLSTTSLCIGAAGAGLQSQKAIPRGSMAGEQPRVQVLTSETAITSNGYERAREIFHHIDPAFHVNGQNTSAQRETNILDDEDESPSVAIVTDSKDTGFKLPILCRQEYSLQSEDAGDVVQLDGTRTHAHVSSSSDQTHIWVKQQQLVSADPYMYNRSDKLEQKIQLGIKNDFLEAEPEQDKDDEFASLALDIDQSIEQLNQLILDLDPEFEPVPTMARGHVTCSTTNGVGFLVGQARSSQSGWRNKSTTNEPASRCSEGDFLQPVLNLAVYKSSESGGLYSSDTVDYGDFIHEADSLLWVDLNQPPPTPAFPVTPPTPYVKGVYDFSRVSLSSPPGTRHLLSRTQQESRGYMDNMTHSSVSSDGDLFHAEVTSRPAPCQRGFGSICSVSTSSPLPNMDSTGPTHSWLESGSNTPLSYYIPQPSPPPLLSTPNAHSSPHALPSSLDVGNLELSLLEAMEGLESLGLNGTQPPLLPQKRRGIDRAEISLISPLHLSRGSNHSGSPTASSPSPDSFCTKADNVKFVQDTSKFWYKPDISREQAIALLKDKDPGAFIVRDSHSFRGAYGLAMKVATPPPSVLQQSKKAGDLTSELVRHFLIECTQKGVRLKGCPNEPYFGSLTALVCQHSITPLALPCKLIIPDRDPLEEMNESQGQTSTNSATELLKQGAACNVWFLGSVELETLTGVQAVQKATTVSLSQDPPATSTIVHFKVSTQGITLTDNQRKLFFRRHYPVNTVIFCALDPQDRKWTRDGCLNAKIFGFVARKSGSNTGNVCHLFAEHDPEQPASAIVNFVSKVMIGSQKAK